MHKSGDFTGLADDYSMHRPNDSSSVLIGLLDIPINQAYLPERGLRARLSK